jgi:hypothetical protein
LQNPIRNLENKNGDREVDRRYARVRGLLPDDRVGEDFLHVVQVFQDV